MGGARDERPSRLEGQPLKTDLAESHARAASNGLTLELGDREWGALWPGKRVASAHLMRGRDQVAGCAMTYSDEAGQKRALSFCASQVYKTPDRVA